MTKPIYWSSGSGRIELEIFYCDATRGSHSGACDDDIADLRSEPFLAKQLAQIDPETLRRELGEYGAWDNDELQDHDANLSRLLWIACGDIRDTHAL